MPKRIVDGDGLWRSDKLANIEPASYRAELANLIPLALANGVFECNPRLVWSRVYAYNRPDVSLEDTVKILDELERVGILGRWDEDGKIWGYWVGIDKKGRLPSTSRQLKKHEAIGPTPPSEILNRKPMVSHSLTKGKPSDNRSLTNGEVGSGFGFGYGNGIGDPPPSSKPSVVDGEDGPDQNSLKAPSERAIELAEFLRNEIRSNKPDFRIQDARLRKWAATADLMLRRDGRTEEQIRSLISWVQHDEFWRANVLSMDKLREKFDQLEIKKNSCARARKPSTLDEAIEEAFR